MITEIESAADEALKDAIDPDKSKHECFFHYTDDLIYKAGFGDGAVWALESTYTEEEVYSIIEQAIKDCYTEELQWHYNGDYRNLKEWFEKYKKK
jgi:hypothetical protein